MDTACFLRKPSVLALWLIAPLALTAVAGLVSRSILEHARSTYAQSKALEHLIPELSKGLSEFALFAATYRIESDAAQFEDRHIALLNAAAEHIDFNITAINITQDPPDKAPEGTVRINILIKGTGSGNGIYAFLNNVHVRDPFAYEKRVQIMPDGTDSGGFALEAELSVIQIAQKGAAQ
ncbi:MAG TPA: hypothetical protein PLD51_00350 [Pontiellaceae bacterium]|nr:hypothetical protein [Pontiellaceae bacterium]